MKVAKLSQAARVAIGAVRQDAQDPEKRREWLLARTRSMSAGLRLVLSEIDEIGISLKNGWITPEHAAGDLASLEQLPVYVASTFFVYYDDRAESGA